MFQRYFLFFGGLLIVPVWIGIYKLLKFFLYITPKFLILTLYQFIKSSIDIIFTKQSKKPIVLHNTTTNTAPLSGEVQPSTPWNVDLTHNIIITANQSQQHTVASQSFNNDQTIIQIVDCINKMYSLRETLELNMKFNEAISKKKKLIFELEPDKKQQLNQEFEIL